METIEKELKKMTNDFKKHIDANEYHSVGVELNRHKELMTGEMKTELQITVYGTVKANRSVQKGIMGIGDTYESALTDFTNSKQKYVDENN